MKLLRFLPILVFLLVGQANPTFAVQSFSCSFGSQLFFTGTQWQVKSSMAPVYLARREAGTWRVLAIFDGTNGKYHLDWQNPTAGEYVALDAVGACSDSVVVRDESGQTGFAATTGSNFSDSRAAHAALEPTEFHRRAVAALSKP